MKHLTLKKAFIILITIQILSSLFTMVKVDKLEKKVDKLEKLVIDEDTTYIETYNTILPKIKAFNPKVNVVTVKRIAKVMHYYGLDKTKNSTNMYVGQLLQESGANQYYAKGHPLEGKLVVSSGGAIGVAQITPTTAMNYLSKIVSKNDANDMKKLGCTDFSFISRESGLKRLEGVRKWLKNEKNNVVMWGFIISNMFNKNKDINKTLVAYNAGLGGLKTYLDSGNVVTNHEYIISIKNKLSLISDL